MPAAASVTAPTEAPIGQRPGWPEIIAGLLTVAVVGYGGTIGLARLPGMTPKVIGVIGGIMSGVAAGAGFLVAWAILRRRRQGHGVLVDWQAFGVRGVRLRWLVIGLAGGLVALVAKIVLTPLLLRLTNVATDTQSDYAAGAQGGALWVALSFLGLVILTPIGEELLFRGVVTTALLRYGPWIATLGSAAIFALMHGVNIVILTAFIVGVINAWLRRRSGSIWPGVIAHAVNNVIAVVAYAMA